MRRVAVALLLVGGVVACFDPSPRAGAPCPTGVCPSGLVCSPASQTCEESAVDAVPPPDAAILVDAAPGCYGVGLVVICPNTMPSTSLTLVGALDTSTSPLCTTAYTGTSGSLCVIVGETITIETRIDITGARPLVLVASKAITITAAGTLDAASHIGGKAGPSSLAASCQQIDAIQDKGGPGGSLGGTGGRGGAGDGGGSQMLAAPRLASLVALRGGCAGGNGSVGIGGRGGGAVYLIAGDVLQIDGTINASGAGGGAGNTNDSGGGGGSGGMIGLDAPTITLGSTARIFANGGGGGASDSNADPGEDPTGPALLARGGRANDGGGANGGDGSAGPLLDGRNGQSGNDGGGGGGGGAGIIKVFPLRSFGPNVSPPAT